MTSPPGCAGATVYTDGEMTYRSLPHHAYVDHGRGEYVRGPVTTNGIECVWRSLERSYHGTHH